MNSEILSLILSFIGGIALMVRWGFLRRLLPPFLGQRILDELSHRRVSLPNLTSTFDSNSSTSSLSK
jgi:hypothetical protein